MVRHATLTAEELARYPGATATERALAHHLEGLGHARPAARPLARVVDLRPYSGRDRTERAMHYLRALTPRSETWSHQALRVLAEQLVASSRVIE
ncbi:MAG: hypothetical protein KF718_15925 [Polyangiaceae bacterium]|nr:hypothetical protein [Polyangiaceae bacterium]